MSLELAKRLEQLGPDDDEVRAFLRDLPKDVFRMWVITTDAVVVVHPHPITSGHYVEEGGMWYSRSPTAPGTTGDVAEIHMGELNTPIAFDKLYTWITKSDYATKGSFFADESQGETRLEGPEFTARLRAVHWYHGYATVERGGRLMFQGATLRIKSDKLCSYYIGSSMDLAKREATTRTMEMILVPPALLIGGCSALWIAFTAAKWLFS